MRSYSLLTIALLSFVVRAESELAAQIDALISPHISSRSPGAAIVVIESGARVFEKGYGLAVIPKEVPIRPNTVFELASCSKQFTAMAIMMLEERGKLKYDDHLSKFFPEFNAIGHPITVEQLLHHTAGLPDYMDAWDKSNSKAPVTSTLMRHLLAKEPKLRFKPGDKYEYSNSGYMMLAQIVEKASGKKFPAFMKENIFEPLGMKDTLVYDETKPAMPHHALCYARKGNEWENTSQSELNAVYGDGSVRSTVEDLFKWDQALYSEKLVKAETLKRAFTEGKTNNGKGTGYGYGWSIGEFHKTLEVSHDGLWLDFNTSIVRLPERHLSVIVLSNQAKFPADEVAHKTAALFFKRAKP